MRGKESLLPRLKVVAVCVLTTCSHFLCSWWTGIWTLSDQGDTAPPRASQFSEMASSLPRTVLSISNLTNPQAPSHPPRTHTPPIWLSNVRPIFPEPAELFRRAILSLLTLPTCSLTWKLQSRLESYFPPDPLCLQPHPGASPCGPRMDPFLTRQGVPLLSGTARNCILMEVIPYWPHCTWILIKPTS